MAKKQQKNTPIFRKRRIIFIIVAIILIIGTWWYVGYTNYQEQERVRKQEEYERYLEHKREVAFKPNEESRKNEIRKKENPLFYMDFNSSSQQYRIPEEYKEYFVLHVEGTYEENIKHNAKIGLYGNQEESKEVFYEFLKEKEIDPNKYTFEFYDEEQYIAERHEQYPWTKFLPYQTDDFAVGAIYEDSIEDRQHLLIVVSIKDILSHEDSINGYTRYSKDPRPRDPNNPAYIYYKDPARVKKEVIDLFKENGENPDDYNFLFRRSLEDGYAELNIPQEIQPQELEAPVITDTP